MQAMTPEPNTMDARRRPRGQLWLLVAMFFVPLIASFILYYGGTGWRPAGSTNKGDLIDPARSLPEVSLPMPDGSRTDPAFLRGRWSMVYIGGGSCDTRCRQALTDMRQVRLALNQNSSRVQRVFLYTGACCDEPYFGTEHDGLITAGVDEPAAGALLALVPQYGDVAPTEAGRIYLVDPLGNLMMSYAADAPTRGVLDDLKKLLNLSSIG